MNEVAASVETETTSEESQTDPWGGELSKTDAALLNKTPEAEDKADEPANDGPEVREQDKPDETQAEEELADEPADEKADEADEKKVPYGAMHEERMRRKEAMAEAQELRDKMVRMEERFKAFQEAIKPEEPEVSFDDDPAEYLRKEAEKTSQTLEQMQKQQQEAMQKQQQQAQANQFISRYQAAAQEYAESNPDFQDAYNHLVNGRVQEHMLAGGMDREQAVALAQREEQAIAARAFEEGVNPAEKLVELAKLRGWTKAPQSSKVNGTVDKVAQVEKGQKAAKTISKGGSSEGELTLEALADMDGEDFDKAWEKLFPAS
jgi:hypothetical protein